MVDPRQHFRSKPIQQVDRLQALVELFHAAGPDQSGVEMFVMDRPGQGDMDQLALEFLLGVLLDCGEVLEVLFRVVGVEEKALHHLGRLFALPCHPCLVLRLHSL